MSGSGFRTAAEGRAAKRDAADREIEGLKRAVETALDAYPVGARERGEALRYCARVGVEVSTESAAAGVEFLVPDPEAAAEAIARTPMPASLSRFAP